MHDLDKMRYHTLLLADALEGEHARTRFIIEKNWSEDDWRRAEDIFEKYEGLIEEGGARWRAMEKELKNEFDTGYQTVKRIVLAFYNSGQFQHVCSWFAESQEPGCPQELIGIMRPGKTDRRRDT